MKKLYRSRTNRVVGGVLGGIGEYLDVDPVFIRVLWIFLFVFTAVVPGLVAYTIAYFLMPSPPLSLTVSDASLEQLKG